MLYYRDIGRLRYKYDSDTGFVFIQQTADIYRQTGLCLDKYGYYVIQSGGKRHMLHRFIWFIVHGVWPEKVIDHVNCDKKDNRLENLEDVSIAENNDRKIEHKAKRSNV